VSAEIGISSRGEQGPSSSRAVGVLGTGDTYIGVLVYVGVAISEITVGVRDGMVRIDGVITCVRVSQPNKSKVKIRPYGVIWKRARRCLMR
jgi:hypothetical protein